MLIDTNKEVRDVWLKFYLL